MGMEHDDVRKLEAAAKKLAETCDECTRSVGELAEAWRKVAELAAEVKAKVEWVRKGETR